MAMTIDYIDIWDKSLVNGNQVSFNMPNVLMMNPQETVNIPDTSEIQCV